MKLAGATLVCAAAAFLLAFFATGAGKTTTTRVPRHAATVAPFADPAARAVAVSLTGHPAALKLPPPPRHIKHQVKHHAKPASVATTPPAVTPTPVTPTPTPTPVYTPPPPKHKSSGGTGTGTTVVGP